MSNGKILLCTTCHLEGYQVEAYYGLVSAHVASGVNALRGWFTAFRDIVGGRACSYGVSSEGWHIQWENSPTGVKARSLVA